MMLCFDNIVTLPSGNTARNFRVNDLGNGRVRIQYVYTDRRRAHQVSRHFTAEFLNGLLQSITARSARSGRVEAFSTSLIIDTLLGMVSEVNRVNKALSNFRKDVTEMRTAETTETNEQEDTNLLNTLKTVGGMKMMMMVMIVVMMVVNILITLATLGIVWYNL